MGAHKIELDFFLNRDRPGVLRYKQKRIWFSDKEGDMIRRHISLAKPQNFCVVFTGHSGHSTHFADPRVHLPLWRPEERIPGAIVDFDLLFSSRELTKLDFEIMFNLIKAVYQMEYLESPFGYTKWPLN